MVPKEEARFGNLPATHWQFTGRLGSLQAALYTVNSQLTRFGNSPVFPLLSDFVTNQRLFPTGSKRLKYPNPRCTIYHKNP